MHHIRRESESVIPSGYIDGLPVIITDAVTKQVRSRTHRKKRIDKKWQKRYGYKAITDNSKCLIYEDHLGTKHLLMSQVCYNRLAGSLAKIGGKA